MGTVVPAVLCPVLVSCQALSRVLIIFLISNGELLCCFSTQILTRQGAVMLILFNFSTLVYQALCNPARNGVVFGRGAGSKGLVVTLLAEAVEANVGPKRSST